MRSLLDAAVAVAAAAIGAVWADVAGGKVGDAVPNPVFGVVGAVLFVGAVLDRRSRSQDGPTTPVDGRADLIRGRRRRRPVRGATQIAFGLPLLLPSPSSGAADAAVFVCGTAIVLYGLRTFRGRRVSFSATVEEVRIWSRRWLPPIAWRSVVDIRTIRTWWGEARLVAELPAARPGAARPRAQVVTICSLRRAGLRRDEVDLALAKVRPSGPRPAAVTGPTGPLPA